MSPEMQGDKILEDPESSSTIRTYLTGKVKSRYKEKLEDHTSEIEELAAENGAKYINVSTEKDFFESFFDIWELINK